jgi:putative endonuclease
VGRFIIGGVPYVYSAVWGSQSYLHSSFMKGGYTYIITNTHNTTLYVGASSTLFNRTIQHREKYFPNSFSARYNLWKLVYYETYDSILDAIAREKQLKDRPAKTKGDVDQSDEFGMEGLI